MVSRSGRVEQHRAIAPRGGLHAARSWPISAEPYLPEDFPA